MMLADYGEIQLTLYQDRFADDFAKINYFWLEQYQLIEEEDRKYLDNPQKYIIDQGGQIFILLAAGEVLGTCALIHKSDAVTELAKFAIIPKAQGRGLGQILVREVIKYCRAHNYQKIILLSSTKLQSALKLYEKVGFQYKALPDNPEYDTADIYMELELDNVSLA